IGPTSPLCSGLASRNPSWQRSCAAASTDRTYDRNRSCQPLLPPLASPGAVHIWSPAASPPRLPPPRGHPQGAPLRINLAWLNVRGHAVDAIAQAGWRRTVRKHVAQVAAAASAMHFGAHHAVAHVLGGADAARHRVIEARPAGAALELGVRLKQRL